MDHGKHIAKNPIFFASNCSQSRFSPPFCLLFAGARIGAALLLTAIAIFPAIAASSDSRVDLEIQEALRLQEALLNQVTDEHPPSLFLESASAPTDPRQTPVAPVERVIPETLFSQETVVIDKGTWPEVEASRKKNLRLLRLSLDADSDGNPEQVRYLDPTTRFRIRLEEDRNYDGQLDAWTTYESNSQQRQLDDRGDGKVDRWEFYEAGRLKTLKIDRSGNGQVDVVMTYGVEFIEKEEHDTNGDGQMDRHVMYSMGHRSEVHEDRSHDGQIDTWITYRFINDQELVTRIAVDKEHRGQANVFDIYAARSDGSSVLKRREEDLNYDGEIDITSFYENGKLKRRQIKQVAAPPTS